MGISVVLEQLAGSFVNAIKFYRLCNIYNMFDSETLRPVIIAIVLFMVIVNLLPKVLKDPTNIKTVDDVTMLSVTLQKFLMPGTILIALIVYFTNYINANVL
jgi:hypothetical protein